MRTTLALTLAALLAAPVAASAQEGRATLERAAAALGAGSLKSIQVTASGVNYQVGQNAAPSLPWPKFNVKSFTRSVNYETASLRDELVRTQAEDPPRGGGGQPVRGEQRQHFALSGDHAWNVVGDVATPAPITLADRQFQLWATPHGVVKAALAGNPTVAGRVIALSAPGRYSLRATLDDRWLVEKVEGLVANPVLGDIPVVITYGEYKDFAGVKFPTKIRQSAGGAPSLDVTVTDVQPNAAVAVAVPDPVRNARAATYYSTVATQMVADGVWYLTGGSHHSVVIEMKDHVIVVEGPLNDQRALAVLAETRKLVPSKPIRYVVNSHHHFDHSGGLRAFAAEGVTIVTHEVNRPFYERAFAVPATVSPDHLARAGRPARFESVADKWVMTDGSRVVEIHHIARNGHHEGMLMVYLPKEKLLSQADAFTPLAADAPVPTPPNPATVNLADNITRLGLAVDRLLPLHGRLVPLVELHRTIGRAN